MVEMVLSKIVIRETSDTQCIYLREKGGSRQFPIVIGIFEALAIDRRVREKEPPRPMTHDLLASVIESLDAELDRVVVSELRENTFHARMVLRRNGADETVEVDARPSDAIATAVRVGARIFVAEDVLDAVLASSGE